MTLILSSIDVLRDSDVDRSNLLWISLLTVMDGQGLLNSTYRGVRCMTNKTLIYIYYVTVTKPCSMRALATAWLHTHCDQHSEIMTGIPQLLSFSHSGQDLYKITMPMNSY